MAITAVDKIKINKYLKEHNINDIYYLEMCEAIGKKCKISNGEFLSYFTDCIISEFNKNEKISSKHLPKLILTVEAFLTWMHDEKDKVDEHILDKIRSFKDFYDEYLNRGNFSKDDEVVACLNTVLKAVNTFYPNKNKDECLVKYINEINDLNEQIKKLKMQLEELDKFNATLKEVLDEKNSNNNDLKNKVVLLNNDCRKKEKEILSLKEEIKVLSTKINNLESLLLQEQTKNELFNKIKEDYDSLSSKLEELLKKIDEESRLKINASILEVKHLELESLIYKKLLGERASVDKLLKYILEQGFVSCEDEVIEILRKIKSKINIDSSLFSFAPTYKVTPPIILEDTKFNINVGSCCKYYDIMLVSDFHIKEFDSNTLAGFDMLYDYCVKNNINLILNLGDFYHGGGSKNLNYETAVHNYKIVEQSVLSLPKVNGVYHAILGGNHDKSILKYGFDPIGFLSSERSDIISLGYTHSTIVLQEFNNILATFDIHHYDSFFPIDLGIDGIESNEINTYLNSLYEKQNRNRKTSYIDLFGHTHKSQLNPVDSYYYVPSFFEDRINNGACHLRIYFDDKANIKYMVFMPLNVDNKLVKNNEIVYKRS